MSQAIPNNFLLNNDFTDYYATKQNAITPLFWNLRLVHVAKAVDCQVVIKELLLW